MPERECPTCEEETPMRKYWIGAAVLAVAGAGAVLVKRLLGRKDPMSGVDASGQAAFDAPEQQMSPAHAEPKRSPEELQREARLATVKDEVLGRWPSLTSADFDAADDDPGNLAETIASRTGEPREQVERALSQLMAGASAKASFPVT
jgi:hypothetical protein